MTAVTVSSTYEGNFPGDIKEVVLALSTSPATGYTYDTLMDATNGRGAMFREIFSAKFTKLAGSEAADTEPSWDASTGIVTLGIITTTPASGYLTIRGK